MRWTVVLCLFLCALVALLRHTKGAVPDSLLYMPFEESLKEVQAEFQHNDLLYSKYGFQYDFAAKMCKSGGKGMADYCNLENLILQLNILQQSWRALRDHKDRRFRGGHDDIDAEKYLKYIDESAKINSLAIDLKIGINMIIETTGNVATSLGSYFENIASIDKKIAEADTGYITDQLHRLNREGDKYFGKHRGNVADTASNILACTIAGLSLQLASKITELAVEMTNMFNPFAVLFDGFDFGPICDLLEEIFDTTMDIQLVIRFKVQMKEVTTKLTDINRKFNSNLEYLLVVMKLLNDDDDFTFEEVIAQKEKFIKLYKAYTPAVTQQDLVELLAKLTYMMEETCSIVKELVASDNPLVKIAIAGLRVQAEENCKKVTVDLQVLDSYYNQIYEFQFDLMDSLAAQMKGKVAVASAKNFLTGFNTNHINLATTTIGLVMDAVGVQAAAHSYCSIIEYERAGVRPSVCKRFTYNQVERQSIKSLSRPACIARNAAAPSVELDYRAVLEENERVLRNRDIDTNGLVEALEREHIKQELEQQLEQQNHLYQPFNGYAPASEDDCTTSGFAYLPTEHINSTGKQYINVTDLFTDNPQYITIPNDEAWLRKYGWLDEYEKVDYRESYFVKRLQLFIPELKCKDPTKKFGAEIIARNGAHVKLHIEDDIADGAGVAGYMIKQLDYTFKWDQRFESGCNRQTFIKRKRDGTEDGTVEVCVRTSGSPSMYTSDLYPSIFNTWQISLENTVCELTANENYDFDITVFYEMAKWKHGGQSEQCWPDPCQAGGICREGLNTYTCDCPSSTSGKNCENGIHVSNTCNKKYNVAAHKPTGMYKPEKEKIGETTSYSMAARKLLDFIPDKERKFSFYAVDDDDKTCAISEESYTPWFYVELPWHAVVCEVKITGELPTTSSNQVKVAVSKNKPFGKMFTQLNDSIHGSDPQTSSDGVYTVEFSPYLATDLYRYLVIYDPDSHMKSRLKICDIQVFSNNGAFNVIGESKFNTQECDWSNNILSANSGTASQISSKPEETLVHWGINKPLVAIDPFDWTCSKTNTYADDTKVWWTFNFDSEATQICGLRITLPEFFVADDGVARLWAGFYYSDDVLEPGTKMDIQYFRPCGDEVMIFDTYTDSVFANCDVLPMNGTQLMIYTDTYLSLCDVQVFAMKKVDMVDPENS